MKNARKLLASLLALCMLLGCFSALADEIVVEEQSIAQEAAQALDYTGPSDGEVTVKKFDEVNKVEVNVESTTTVTVSVGDQDGDSRTFTSERTPFKEIDVEVTRVYANDNNDGVTISSGVNGQIEDAGVINVNVIKNVTADENGIVIGKQPEDASSTATPQGGKVTVGEDFTATPDVAAVYARTGNAIEVHASDSEVTIKNGDVKGAKDGIYSDGSGSKITVENGNVTGEEENAIEVRASNSEVTIENGDVKGAKDGIYSDGSGSKITVENGDVTGESGYGVVNWSPRVDITVNGSVTGGKTGVGNSYGKVTVTGDVTGANCGVKDAYGEVTVNGSVKATGAEGADGLDEGTGVSAGEQGATVTVDGDVEGAVCGVEAKNGATVTVGGDVKGTGSESVGIMADAHSAGGNVIVDGTVSGKAAAIQFFSAADDGSVDLGKAQVTVWAAELNDGSVATVKTTTKSGSDDSTTEKVLSGKDEKVAEVLKQSINYIIRAASAANNALKIDEVEGQGEVAGYKTAHEGEEVTFTLDDYEDGDELEIYYNGERGDKLTKGSAASATAYSIAGKVITVLMRRGGAMSLLASITKANTASEETKPEETKPEETKPEETKPEETKPEETKPEETKPEETKPEETKPEETKPEEIADESGDADDAEDGAKKDLVFTYVPVDALHGVTSADRPAAADAMKSLADSLGEGAKVEIVDADKVVPAGQFAAFDALPLADRLAIAMQLLGCGEAENLSEEGTAVLADIGTALDALTDAEKEARQADIDGRFLPRLVIVDGAERKSVGLELKITRGGDTARERWTFFEDEDAWKLFQIEKGVYKEA